MINEKLITAILTQAVDDAKYTGTRKKYYNFTNKKIDALLYEKTINDTIKS